jgi:succinate dehydrogenase/fumarate reductase cytochrome b subunit
MFVWVFHRISGVLLLFLMAFQLFTGFFQASSSNLELVKTIADLHKHAALNCLLVLLVIFHALYGVRTILIDLGVRRERLLFWVCNAVGLALFGGFLVLFFTLVAS